MIAEQQDMIAVQQDMKRSEGGRGHAAIHHCLIGPAPLLLDRVVFTVQKLIKREAGLC